MRKIYSSNIENKQIMQPYKITQMSSHFSIKGKIYNIIFTLLGLMVAVTYLSGTHLKQVGEHSRLITGYYIPLDQFINDAHIHFALQNIYFNEVDYLLQSIKPDIQAIQEHKSLYQASEQKSLEALTAGKKKVDDLLEELTQRNDTSHIRRMTEIEMELGSISGVVSEYREQIRLYLAKVENFNSLEQRTARTNLEADKAHIDELMDKVEMEFSEVSNFLEEIVHENAADIEVLENQARFYSWGLTGIAALLGLLISTVIVRGLMLPIHRLLFATKQIMQGDLDVQIQNTTHDELADLGESFNHMVNELRDKQVIMDIFGKYIDPRVAQVLIENHLIAANGERQVMTIAFSDLEGFTGLCEQLTPDTVVKFLNYYFTVMSEPIQKHRGIVDKYIGDAIMCFWGAPFCTLEEQAYFACLAALDQKKCLVKMSAELPNIVGLRKGLPSLNMRVGIATGEVTAGSIGPELSKSYTVIGDAANLSSRLESLNKYYGTHILICEHTYEAVAQKIVSREIDSVCVSGKTEPCRVYEVVGHEGQIDPESLSFIKHFEDGLALYRERDWQNAMNHFTTCLSMQSQDGPSKLYMDRIVHFLENPPSEDWHGVHYFKEK